MSTRFKKGKRKLCAVQGWKFHRGRKKKPTQLAGPQSKTESVFLSTVFDVVLVQMFMQWPYGAVAGNCGALTSGVSVV
uniref:Uncharacterized protein n=1 Tax=Anguilla anguilla TaxID=7936 RepID=A0A0E9VSK7_ANGAN